MRVNTTSTDVYIDIFKYFQEFVRLKPAGKSIDISAVNRLNSPYEIETYSYLVRAVIQDVIDKFFTVIYLVLLARIHILGRSH